jgi:hypothetical protein
VNCEAAKGFLTQSNCGASAASACQHCGRSLCSAHLSPQSGFTMCFDCAATQQPRERQETEGEYDETWAHGYRASYYSSTGYRPYSSGSSSDTTSGSSYDRNDIGSFDRRPGEDFDEDREPGGFDAS